MSSQITSNNFHLSSKLVKLVKEKITKLQKFIVGVNEDLRDIRVVVDKAPRFGYVVELELWIPNKSFIARAGNLNIEGAVDDAVEEMIRQLKRYKGKITRERSWRIRRKLKNFLFFSKFSEEL